VLNHLTNESKAIRNVQFCSGGKQSKKLKELFFLRSSFKVWNILALSLACGKGRLFLRGKKQSFFFGFPFFA
jgi:hypothetical protein